MSEWRRGQDSTVYRFEKHHEGANVLEVEVEIFDSGEAEVRAIQKPGRLPDVSNRFESAEAALDFAREEWDIDADALPDRPTVRVKRQVLSILADYVGTDAVFGHDVPAETRDALAAAYEALDEPGLPLSFYDCPNDGAALDSITDDSDHPPHIEPLECPECGKVYHLDRDTGELGTGN